MWRLSVTEGDETTMVVVGSRINTAVNNTYLSNSRTFLQLFTYLRQEGQELASGEGWR